MPISSYLLSRSRNRFIVLPCWATLDDWLLALTQKPLAAPLVDFSSDSHAFFKVGTTRLNWFLMDLLGLREGWLSGGAESHDELWLLINPRRYWIMRRQPQQPYPLDVRDYLKKIAPHLLHETLSQHAYFAMTPVVYQDEMNDRQVERKAATAPWHTVTVMNQSDQIIGMVWSYNPHAGTLPPILKPPYSIGNVTYNR